MYLKDALVRGFALGYASSKLQTRALYKHIMHSYVSNILYMWIVHTKTCDNITISFAFRISTYMQIHEEILSSMTCKCLSLGFAFDYPFFSSLKGLI